MQSIFQATRHIEGGDPLPTVFPSLADLGFNFRRGELSLIAAGAGVGKSVFAQWHALYAGVPTVYMSADSGAHTIATRQAAMLTGRTQDVVRDEIEYQIGRGWDALLDDAGSHIKYDFDSSPTVVDIGEEVMAFYTAHGDTPDLIVMDNLRNVAGNKAGLENHLHWGKVLDFLHTLARDANAHVMALHHVVGQYSDGNAVVPMSGLDGKVSQLPEQVLTLSRTNDDLTVAIVKNRGGRMDAAGAVRAQMQVALDRMQLVG